MKTSLFRTLAVAWIVTGTVVAGETPAGPALDPDRIDWTEAHFFGSRLFISLDARLSLDRHSGDEIAPLLLELPEAAGRPVYPANGVIGIGYETRVAGRHSEIVLYMNPADGAALQRIQQDTRGRLRERTYRYGNEGALLRTRSPADGEEHLDPEQWSEVSSGVRAMPEPGVGEVITEPAGIFYILGAAALEKPGDRIEFLAYSRRSVHRVEAIVIQPRPINVEYELRRPGEYQRVRGRTTPLRLLVRGESLDDDDDEFELLGLRGDIELYMDPDSRAPLELSGNVRIAGRVTLRARALTLE